ncbi:MAG: hypothetical protein ACK559_40950, partial [bacterium]
AAPAGGPALGQRPRHLGGPGVGVDAEEGLEVVGKGALQAGAQAAVLGEGGGAVRHLDGEVGRGAQLQQLDHRGGGRRGQGRGRVGHGRSRSGRLSRAGAGRPGLWCALCPPGRCPAPRWSPHAAPPRPRPPAARAAPQRPGLRGRLLPGHRPGGRRGRRLGGGLHRRGRHLHGPQLRRADPVDGHRHRRLRRHQREERRLPERGVGAGAGQRGRPQ